MNIKYVHPITICSFFFLRNPFLLTDFLEFQDRMAYQECREFLAPQGRKDNKEKMELRGSLVSRDREVWREQEDKKEIQGHLVKMVHLEWWE